MCLIGFIDFYTLSNVFDVYYMHCNKELRKDTKNRSYKDIP